MKGAWEARSGSQAKFYLERYLEKNKTVSAGPNVAGCRLPR